MGREDLATGKPFRAVEALRELAHDIITLDWCRGPTSGPAPAEARLAYSLLHGAADELGRGRVGEAVMYIGNATQALRAIDAPEHAARCAELSESLEFGS